jgi:hypothetical protein
MVVCCKPAEKAIGKGHVPENILIRAVPPDPSLAPIGGLIEIPCPAIAGIKPSIDEPAFERGDESNIKNMRYPEGLWYVMPVQAAVRGLVQSHPSTNESKLGIPKPDDVRPKQQRIHDVTLPVVTSVCGPEDKVSISGNPAGLGVDEVYAVQPSRGPARLLNPPSLPDSRQ